jgi:hypothetical protein
MNKEKDIQILEHKISEINRLLLNFDKYNINEKKKEALELKKLKYEDQLIEIQLT